jgi:membrane protease YdiL (CAAX protease family)
MKVAMAFFAASIVLRAFGIDWGTVDPALLLVVIASGVLVGFAEEMLFRGVFLRSMRTNGRTEAVAALWTAIAFGLFHLPNLLVGAGPLSSSRSCLRRQVAPPCTCSGVIGASS